MDNSSVIEALADETDRQIRKLHGDVVLLQLSVIITAIVYMLLNRRVVKLESLSTGE